MDQVAGDATKRDHIISKYDHRMKTARWLALGVAVLQNLTRFLAYCNLTWATVVLLGGFASSLRPLDFRFVISLLLIEAVRLATAMFFSKLVTRGLRMQLSQNPVRLGFDDFQGSVVRVLRIIALVGQIIFISPSLVLPSTRLHSGQYDVPGMVRPLNLHLSLRVFYILVLANSSIALIAVICSAIALSILYDASEWNVERYHDEVLQRAFDYGVVQADDFEFLEFALKLLGQIYSRNVQPKVVVQHYKGLMEYMYAHRRGVDMVVFCMDCDEYLVQYAAVSVVGSWADQDFFGLSAHLPSTLLTKLADKLGNGQIGWQAANSLGILAEKHPETLVRICDSSRNKVMDILIDQIDPYSRRSLVFVRVLNSFFENANAKGIPFDDTVTKQQSILVAKLREILEHGQLQRMKVVAASVLKEMRQLREEEDHASSRAINPELDGYFLQSEAILLDVLRQQVLDLPGIDWNSIKEGKFIRP